jgi:hypothetical protein
MLRDQGEVIASIAIEGIVFWHVLYVSDDGELKRDGTTSEPSEFPLGTPEKLHLDVNTWHIVITNQTIATVKYIAGIKWKQGTKAIAQWGDNGPKKGSLKSGETIVLDSSALLAIVPAAAPTEDPKATGEAKSAGDAPKKKKKKKKKEPK